MARIEDTSVGIDQVIRLDEVVPRDDEVGWCFAFGSQVAIHAQEPCQGTVSGVMETSRIESILAFGTNKQAVICVVGGQLDSFVGIVDSLVKER